MNTGRASSRNDREPSWRTALAEAETAGRRVGQAAKSLDRLSEQLRALREWAERTVRLELARELTDGPDGGVLNVLTTTSKSSADADTRRTAEILLERLTAALGLEPIVKRGEYLRLLPDEAGEFEVRVGAGAETPRWPRQLYCVVRPGWCLGSHLVVRPLLEAVSADQGETGSATCVGF